MLTEKERKVIEDTLKCKTPRILNSITCNDTIELLDINEVENNDKERNYITLITSAYILGFMRGKGIK